jgi:hypothetical protein
VTAPRFASLVPKPRPNFYKKRKTIMRLNRSLKNLIVCTLAFVLTQGPILTVAASVAPPANATANSNAKASPKPKPQGASARRPSVVKRRERQTPPLQPGQTATQLPDGRWLLVGGADKSGISSAIEICGEDETTRPTAVTARLKLPCAYHTATLTPSGEVMTCGGVGRDGRTVGDVEFLDTTTLTIRERTGGATFARARHTATVMTDGRILFVGGADDANRALSAAAVYDPRADVFTSLGSALRIPRADHTATLLPDGGALISGGRDQFGNPMSIAERYDPTEGVFAATPATAAQFAALHPTPTFMASSPTDGAENVPPDVVIAIRFSEGLRVNR